MQVAIRSLLVLAVASLAVAAPPGTTVITVPDMDCPGCAKTVGTAVVAVPGVAQVVPNVDNRQLVVTARPNAAPSPRALWEAVEKAGFAPSKLDGPGGVVTAKPRS